MATEIARIDIHPGSNAEFEAAVTQAAPLFGAAAGSRGMRLLRSHEEASRYWLVIEWDDVAAHEAFRETPEFAQWRALAGPFFAGRPEVEHGLDIGISA
jgi:heme-degrading monooxygenase HmoA